MNRETFCIVAGVIFAVVALLHLLRISLPPDLYWRIGYPAVQSWLVEGQMQFDHLKRREFITLIDGAAVAWPLAARAQQPTKERCKNFRSVAVILFERS